MKKKLLLLVITFLLFIIPVQASVQYDYQSPAFKENASEFMCMCGCGESSYSCSMQSCGMNDAFKADLLEKMNQGMDGDELKEYYLSMYGEVILSAPQKSGFSLLAWILPFIAIATAGTGVTIYVKRLVTRSKLASTEKKMESAATQMSNDEELLSEIIDEERKKLF